MKDTEQPDTTDLSKDTFFDFNKYIDTIDYHQDAINKIYVQRHVAFKKSDSEMTVSFGYNAIDFSLIRDRFSSKTSCLIIASKDNSNILEHCLNKIREFEIDKDHDILLIDDRSKTEDILKLSDKYNTSYLRINNEADVFNYSVLMNIGAMYCLHKNKSLLIFYNNDVWPKNKKTLPNIIKHHKKNKAAITGCLLTYPTQQGYKELKNTQHYLKESLNNLYDTIQHGGIFFHKTKTSWMPAHLWRYYPKNNPMACNNNRCFAVTGAIHIINTKDFFDIKGYNIGMGIAFQDIALCIEACLQNKIVYYVGTECLYHGESLTHILEKITETQELVSDNLLWAYLYGQKIANVIGYLK